MSTPETRPSQRNKEGRIMKSGKWVAVMAVLALGVGLGVWRWKEATAEPPPAPPLETVARRTIEVVTESSGVLEPIRWVEVKSKASGEVRRVEAETGTQVQAGALLAEIDPRDVENAYQQAVADLEAARVKFSTTDAQRKRLATLRESGVVTQQELETSVDAAASARATLVRAETNLQLAKDRRQDAVIRAPIAGTIIERTAEIGQIIASATSNVSGGTMLFKMADLSVMQVRAKVDETDLGSLSPGLDATVTVEAYPGRTFRGKVLKIEPQSVVEQNVTMFPVLIRLDNSSGLLRPGMNAEVRVEIARRPDVLSVSNGAIVTLKDARAAAKAAGVDEAQVREALRRGTTDAPAAGAGETQPSQDCRALRARATDGGVEVLSEELQAQLARCREERRAAAESAGAGAPGTSRPGVVFVQTQQGVQVRKVTLGLSNWDHTEVASGLELGDQVVLISLAQVEQRKQEMTNQIRQRAGGAIPGASGGRGAGRGG